MPVSTVPTSTAEELLNSLSASGKALPAASRPYQFLFRGHSDARFSLLPSAHRAGTRIPVQEHVLEVSATWTIADQIAAERDSLLSFFWFADQAGLYLPGDSPDLRRNLGKPETLNCWPILGLFSVMALAQHHGLPTRLLDWSRSSGVAAYFAAKQAAGWVKGGLLPPADVRDLSVWALHAPDNYLENKLLPSERGFDTPALRIVTAPQASNPNLHAQRAVSTLLQEDTARRGARFVPIPLDRMADRFDPPLDFWQFTLPIEQAPKLLRLLAFDGICAAGIFPGYGGVVEALKERSSFWD